MLLPRYFFTRDYVCMYPYFLTQPHTKKLIRKGDYLRPPHETIKNCFYIVSGVAIEYVEHEDGHRKILDFHGEGHVTPGCHESEFKIEKSICSIAVTDMETLCFRREDFYRMYQEDQTLRGIVLETYAKYINLLIYEVAHQKFNNLFLKVCNLLYLIAIGSDEPNRIGLSQENLADILGTNRVNITKCITRLREERIIEPHRGWIELLDLQGLGEYCSEETQPEL